MQSRGLEDEVMQAMLRMLADEIMQAILMLIRAPSCLQYCLWSSSGHQLIMSGNAVKQIYKQVLESCSGNGKVDPALLIRFALSE